MQKAYSIDQKRVKMPRCNQLFGNLQVVRPVSLALYGTEVEGRVALPGQRDISRSLPSEQDMHPQIEQQPAQLCLFNMIITDGRGKTAGRPPGDLGRKPETV